MSYVSGEGQASGRLDSSVSGGAGMTKASLKPKEHGAYAILAIPLLTAIAASGVTAVGFATAVAAVAGFIAHEPLLVMVGHRGQRAQRGTPGARWRLIVLLGIVAIAGGCAVIQGTRESRWVLLSCGCLAISSFAIAVVGKHRTLAGQLWGVAGLSSPCVPVLVSGDYPIQLAIQVWLAWVLGFASTTLAVHGVIAKQKRRSRLFYSFAIPLLMVASWGLFIAGYEIFIAIAPMVGMSGGLIALPPPARYLKQIGWTLIGGTVASAVWITISL